jgi:Na+/H+ antiporter NhaD/arsenite permease-like protein
MGLFVVTGAFQATGYGEQAVQWLAHVGLNLQSPLVLTVVTAVLSNLINNSAAAVLLVKLVDVTHPPTAYVLAFRDFARLGVPVTLAALAGLIGWAALVN